MLAAVLVSLFLDQFRLTNDATFQAEEVPQYIQSVHPPKLIVVTRTGGTASVPHGASRVEMLHLDLTADCSGNVDVHTLSLQRRGLGANEDVAAVYAMQNGKRISNAVRVAGRDGTVNLHIRGLVIPACAMNDIVIFADFSADASPAGEHRFELLDIDAGVAVVRVEHHEGDFNRSIIAGESGQVAVEYLRPSRNVRFGSRQTLLRFTLTANSETNQIVTAMTFTNLGSATDTDLRNLFLDFRNRRISNIAPNLSGDSVRLAFDPPYRLERYQTMQFSLRADVRAGKSRTIQFVIEEPSDLETQPLRGR